MNNSMIFTAFFVVGYAVAGHVDESTRRDWEALQYSPHYVLGLTSFKEDRKEDAVEVCKKHNISFENWLETRSKLTQERSLSFFWHWKKFKIDHLLIAQKLNVVDAGGHSVLMGAAFNNDIEKFKRLISAEGADIAAENKHRETLKHYIKNDEMLKMIDQLSK